MQLAPATGALAATMTAPAAIPPRGGVGERAESPPAAVIDRSVVALIAGIAAGDNASLASFYEAWFDRAFDVSRALTRRDESFCLDVVQEAMLKAIRKLRPALGISTRAALDAWFTRVLHTTAIDLLRRESRRLHREIAASARRHAPAPVALAADEIADLDERIGWIAAELDRLGTHDLSLVSLRFAQDQSLDAVGKQHRMSVGAVHGRLRRLLDRLRRAGKERFHD